MNRRTLSVLVVVCGGPCVAAATDGAEPKPIRAGDYTVSFTATEGSLKGGVVEGSIKLVAASSTDISPRTGERAKDSRPGRVLFYGWTGANLKAVGAPVCSGHPNPSPDSRDPVYPGIVVIRVPYGPRGPFTGKQEVETLLVNTLSNLRNGEEWTDGCGFAMYLLTADGQCYAGQWKQWGLRVDGCGTFRMCPK